MFHLFLFFKVGASEASLLQMLNIRPFHYGLVVKTVYDNGSVFNPSILDITDDDLLAKFAAVSTALVDSSVYTLLM